MICYFANRRMAILGMASTELPDSLRISNDSEVVEIETGVTTLTFTINYKKGQVSEMQTLTSIGNYVLMEDEQRQGKFYTVITKEHDRKERTIDLYCEDAGLDLLNEAVTPWDAPAKAQSIDYYINKAAYDSGFEIGINEVGNLSRKLSWEGEATATERLLSIATQFDHAEIGFSFAIERMVVTHKYINIYKKRGSDTGLELRLGQDVDNIIDKESIDNLATALRVTGGTPEGKETPINLKGYNYDDGDIYTDGIYLKSRSGLAEWSRYLSESGKDVGHITVNYSYDTLSQSELCNRAITQLKKLCQVEINYEVDIVDLPKTIQIGDRVNIIDEEGKLYLEARILRLEKSRSDNSNSATLGEFLIKDSGISQRLQDLADKVAAIKAGDTFYPWVRYADDDKGTGISPMPLNKKYMAIKYGLNQPTPSDDPTDYQGLWTRIGAEDGKPGKEGPAGSDGKPTFMWVMYADTFNGYGISNKPEGKKYIGLAYNKSVSTPSNTPSDYAWSAMYDEAKLEEMQERLNSIVYSITSVTAPRDPVVNQQWWQQDFNNPSEIIGYFVWDGKNWQPQTIQQSILNVVKLNAVEIVGSKITGTDIFGSSINNTFTVNSQGYTLVGTTTLKDSEVLIDFVVKETSQFGFTKILPQGLQSVIYGQDGKIQQSLSLTSKSLDLQDSSGNSGFITAENLTKKPWINIPLSSGWRTSEGNTPQYRKIRNLDGSESVQFRGQVERTSGTITASNSHTYAILPVLYRPSKNAFAQGASATPYYGARLGALTSGELRINAPVATEYVVLDQLSYII